MLRRSTVVGFAFVVGLTGLDQASGQPTGHARPTSERTSAVDRVCHRASSPPQSSEGPRSLISMQFVSSTTGWAVGGDRVLATTDGGGHWLAQRNIPHARYDEVDAINRSDVWVVGARRLIRSTNGGRTWHQLPEPCPAISSVHFVSPRRGFAVVRGELRRTRDSGRTWKPIPAPKGVDDECFTGRQRGWVGARGRIYRTADAGRHWRLAVRGEHGHRAHGDQLGSVVQCAGQHAGWAELLGGGASSQQDHIGYYLSDRHSSPIFAEQYFPHSGVTVGRESPSSYYGGFSAIDAHAAAFVDNCVACSYGVPKLQIATDAGHRFSDRRRVRSLTNVSAVSFVSRSVGWAMGQFSRGGRPSWRIVRTSDGGRQWVKQYSQ